MIVLPENPIGIQLYTVREVARDDFPGTLRRLAEGGARAVEFAGYGGMPVHELRVLLDDLGLRAAGTHVPIPDWTGRPAECLREIVALGGEYAIVPWVPEERRASVAAARELAASLTGWAIAARNAGLGFAYHHHAFEFDPLPDGDGDTLFDIIVKETDPELVGIEVDVYWAARGGLDPAHLLRELSGRVPLVHLKDLGPDPGRADLPAGTGTLRWDEILPAATAAGAAWWVIEQDNPADPVADALAGVRNIEALAG